MFSIEHFVVYFRLFLSLIDIYSCVVANKKTHTHNSRDESLNTWPHTHL